MAHDADTRMSRLDQRLKVLRATVERASRIATDAAAAVRAANTAAEQSARMASCASLAAGPASAPVARTSFALIQHDLRRAR